MNTEERTHGNGGRRSARVIQCVCPTLKRSARMLAAALAVGLLAGTAGVAHAAISVTATNSSGWVTNRNPTLSFSFTPVANGRLFVMFSGEYAAASNYSFSTLPTAPVWDDGSTQTSMTRVTNIWVNGADTVNQTNPPFACLYYLDNPTSGSGTVRVTLHIFPNRVVIGALYATGVGALEALGGAAAGATTSPDTRVKTLTAGPITATAGALVMDVATHTGRELLTTGGITGDAKLYNPQSALTGGGASYLISSAGGSYSATWAILNTSAAQREVVAIASFAAAPPPLGSVFFFK